MLTLLLEFIGTKLNLNFNDDIYTFLATRIRRDFSTMKDTLIALDKFIYAEKTTVQKDVCRFSAKQFKINLNKHTRNNKCGYYPR